jgi:hypothetical protein
MKEFSAFYVDLFVEIWQDLVFFFRDVLWRNTIVRLYENIVSYWNLLIEDSSLYEFSTLSWVMVVVAGILNITLVIFIILRIYLWIKKYLSFRRVEIEKNELIEEIAELNDRVIDLVDEKNQILAMKVSQLGINARTGDTGEVYNVKQELQPAYGQAGYSGSGGNVVISGPGTDSSSTSNIPTNSRFIKLIQVDKEYAGKDTHIYMEDSDYVTLPELVTRFVNFAASQLKLFYTPKMVSFFFAGMAASKILILEGISGTGKTSLPYAMGKFFDNPAEIISVQPAWRDRAEIIGYLNEFTKRFNETDFLKALYEANYRKDINLIVLDELNLARIEYYFAEFLSIMEMPDPNEWKIDLVPDSKPSDPLKVINGKVNVPLNVWFVGTSNKDDSTFTITDKVYDRAISLEFDAKGEFFQAPETEPVHISSTYLQELFDEAFYKFPISEETLNNFKILDKYIQAHFRIAFGNRIMAQVYKFVPVYVACGGTELDGLDYIFAYKVLRKFESLNLAFLQNELSELIVQIKKIFGKNAFEESVEFIKNLQKLV